MENVTTEGKNGKYTRHFNGFCGATCSKAYLKHIISLKNTLKSVGGYFLGSDHNLYFYINVFASIQEEKAFGK